MNSRSFLVWSSAAVTHTGKVRSVNQDACLDLPELGLWVIADGMGGHEAGDVASRTIIDFFKQMNEPHDLNSFIAEAQHTLIDVNQNLRLMAAQQYNNATIGSTVVILLAYGSQCACLWVGDSRIYRLRNDKLEQLTKDHSMVEKYIDEGVMSPQEAHNSNIANALTRAIGGEDELEIDVKIEEMQENDRFLLCSDGLYREVSHETMRQLMSQGNDCANITKSLLEHALSNTAKDNITVSVVQIKDAYD
ncbi:Protein serine/threonine phosphatase PrpC, regulation of stationary phase [hydrothermal vent metagenome]|uniref:Protein serine/threonine phosphatase PrpC, regulation of stationary phase n=1 Tax=hydrothermal vent metagenome TaxID=652676 RepID=A0A3B0Y1C6_9ZZZZ